MRVTKRGKAVTGVTRERIPGGPATRRWDAPSLRIAAVMTLRYRTWRCSILLGAGLIALSFVGGICFCEERWASVFDLLFWAVVVVVVVFNIAVRLLKKGGLLEFTYTEADRASYFYNMEKLQGQVTESRRAGKRR